MNWRKQEPLGVSNWQEAAEKSKIPRIPWKRMLGIPLTQWLFKKFSEGWSKERCIRYLIAVIRNHYENELKPLGWSMEKAIENMKINVTARYAEYRRKGKTG